MQYQVVVTNYRINGIKYRRGDIVEMSEERAAAHGVKLQPYVEPEVKPKRKRRTRAEMEAARKANNEEE